MITPLRVLLLLALAALSMTTQAEEARQVELQTSAGSIVIELYPDRAPQTVKRFLARAGLSDDGVTADLEYLNTGICQLYAQAFVVFGCPPPAGEDPRPKPSGKAQVQPDEIDAKALRLDRRILTDPKEIDRLWQLEIYPRYLKLRGQSRAIPKGLAALVAAIKTEGIAAKNKLKGRSQAWYLEQVGFEYHEGLSGLAIERGMLATASTWPGEADERFLIAFAPLPERDGRATVFGRVISGWETLDKIRAIPLRKGHLPTEEIRILAFHWRSPEEPAR